MALHLANVTFDCDDTLAVSRFWSAVLDRPVDPDPTPFFASIGSSRGANGGSDRGENRDGPAFLFVRVPEPKTAKNRCHVDLNAETREAVQAEVERLTALGATVIREPKEEWGIYWATLQDPEGNEFCVGAE